MSQKRRTRRRFSPEQKVAILKRYEITGSVEPSPHGGGKPPKLTSEQREIVLELVEEDNDATLEQLCHRLEAKTGIKVSVPTMCRWLQRWGLTRKKKTLHASEAESERVQKLRKQYWTTIGEVKLSDLVFIEETGVNISEQLSVNSYQLSFSVG